MQALKRHALIEQPAWFRLYLKAPQPPLQATNRHATPKAEYCAQSHVRPSWFFAVLKTPTGRNSGMFGAQFRLKQNKLSKAPVSVAREKYRSGVKRSRSSLSAKPCPSVSVLSAWHAERQQESLAE